MFIKLNAIHPVLMVFVWPKMFVYVVKDIQEIHVTLQVDIYTDIKVLCNDISVYTTCEYNPCENGGTCQYHAGTYFCTCSDQFVGERCENECKFLLVPL